MLLLITRTFFNLLIMSGFISIYFIYLYVYENKIFQETILNLTHFSIKTYSYMQIYYRKTKNFYLNYLHPHIMTVSRFLYNKIKETDFFKQIQSSIEKIKKHSLCQQSQYESDSDDLYNDIEEYVIDFIKDNQIVFNCSKEEILNKYENNIGFDFDFIICTMNKNDVLFNKIFYDIPTSESDLEFKNIYCDIRSFTIVPKNENMNPIDIQFTGDNYYFWVENNVIGKDFLNYFLKIYYSIDSDQINDYQLQIITKDIDIYHLNINQGDSFKVLEKGIELTVHSGKNLKEETTDLDANEEDVEEIEDTSKSNKKRKKRNIKNKKD